MSIAPEPDYDHLLRSNLERVFNERDAAARLNAVQELYVDHPVMYEPEAIVEGQAAISDIADQLQQRFGPTFTFVPESAAVGHHGLAVLRWRAGPKDGPVAVTGMICPHRVDRLVC